MSKHDDLARVRHMLDAAEKARTFVRRRSRKDLETDEQLSFAVVHSLEVLGEAAKGVSIAYRKRAPEIPWNDVARTRDRLIHGYFDVNFDIVWDIVHSDLPKLIPQLKQLLRP